MNQQVVEYFKFIKKAVKEAWSDLPHFVQTFIIYLALFSLIPILMWWLKQDE